MVQQLSSLQSAIEEDSGKHQELEFMLGLVVKLLEEFANTQIANTQVTLQP